MNQNWTTAQWVEDGDIKFNDGHYADAIKSYNQALVTKPNDHEVLYKRGQAFSFSKRWQQAINDYDQARQSVTNNSEFKWQYLWYSVLDKSKGESYSELQNYNKAIELFHKALDYILWANHEPEIIYLLPYESKSSFFYYYDLCYILYLIGNCYMQFGDYNKAKKYYKTCLDCIFSEKELAKTYVIDGLNSWFKNWNKLAGIACQLAENLNNISEYEEAISICQRTLRKIYHIAILKLMRFGHSRHRMYRVKCTLPKLRVEGIQKKSIPSLKSIIPYANRLFREWERANKKLNASVQEIEHYKAVFKKLKKPRR